MSYSTSTPPRLLVESIGGDVPNIWVYANTDSNGTVEGAGYITNAKDLGMKVNDVMLYVKTDTNAAAIMICTAVATTGSTFGSSPATIS